MRPGHDTKLPTKRSQRPNTRGGADMPKYSVDIVAKWDGEIVAEGEDEAVEQAIDLFQKEYIITDLNLDATNKDED